MNPELNPEQKLAAEAPPQPLLIVAGAGTGKTRTLIGRLTHFIESGVRPERICAITFTNKAAKEMAERVKSSKLGVWNPKLSPFIGTFHALGAKILRQEARLMGRRPNFVIFDDHDSFDLIKKIVKKLVPPEEGRRRQEKSVATAFFREKIADIKNTNSARNELAKSQRPQDRLALKAYENYEKELKNDNAFDFDDLIEKVVNLFQKHPETLQKYQKKFDAILVDEYQDLNPKQYELVKLLAGKHHNLSVVGDDEQMIYSWRYASLATFLNFERDWPGAQIKFLEENYRSTSNIIEAASAVTQNNQYRRPKNLWTRNPAGVPIKVAEVNDEDEEAEWLASEIAEPKFLNPKQTTAVLYRTNAQSRALEQALIRHEIPYQIFGGVKFYERKEIKDIVAALRYASNNQDELSRERLEKGLGQRRFGELKAALTSIKDKQPVKLVDLFIKTTDYLDYLERNFLNYAEREENIAELVNFASRSEKLPTFLEEVALVQSTDNLASSKSRHVASKTGGLVNLMTIHLAKGLEFDKVFIAGCSEGLLPHSMSLENDYELEEERRLFYVAMTRAKSELCLSFYDLPSRFLGEIPDELMKLESVDTHGTADNDTEEKFVRLD